MTKKRPAEDDDDEGCVGGSVDRKERLPWYAPPEKGQYIRPWGTRLAIIERVGAMIAGAVVMALIIWALTLAGFIHW